MPIVDPYQGELFNGNDYNTSYSANFQQYKTGALEVEEEVVTEHEYDAQGRCVKTTRKVLKMRTLDPLKHRPAHTPWWTTPYTPQYTPPTWTWNPNQVTC